MFCKTCTKRSTCKEVCPELEEHLKDQGVYSTDYIRKSSDTPMSPQKLDHVSVRQAMKLRGKRSLNHQENVPEDENLD